MVPKQLFFFIVLGFETLNCCNLLKSSHYVEQRIDKSGSCVLRFANNKYINYF